MKFVGKTFNAKWIFAIVYAAVIAVMALLFTRLPSSFVPEEDQGVLMTLVQLPAGSTLDQTAEVMEKIGGYFHEQEKDNIESVFTISGFSFGASGQNAGLAFVKLKDWSERTSDESLAQAIADRAMALNVMIPEATLVYPIAPPAIQGFGNSSGFDLQLQDIGGVGHEKLLEARNMLLGMSAQNENVAGVRPNGQENAPKLKVNINQEQAAAYNLNMATVNGVLAQAFGGSYVNDFIDRGRIKSIYARRS